MIDKSNFPTAAQLVARLDKLASLPTVVQEVLKALDSRRSSSKNIAAAVEKDPPLTARLLRVANSAMYARSNKINKISDAVSRLGVKEVRKAVVTTALADVFVTGKSVALRDLYLQSLLSAAASDVIVEQVPALKDGRSNPFFTAALLHDVGLFALQRFAPEALGDTVSLAKVQERPLVDVEKELLGYGHTDVGATLLGRWRLSEMEVEACRWHHAPDGAPAEHQKTAHVLHLTDVLVANVHPTESMSVLVRGLNPGTFAALGLADDAMEALTAGMEEAQEQTKELAKSILG